MPKFSYVPITILFGLALAGCQTTGPTSLDQASAVATPTAVPISKPVTIRETSKTKESVSVTEDGGIRTKTTTTAASATVDTAALVNVLLGANAQAATVTPAEMAGNWTLVQPDGKSCNVTLRTFGNSAGGSFGKAGCFHETVFSAMNWELRPGQIVLTDAVRKPVATLSLAGRNQASGAGIKMFR